MSKIKKCKKCIGGPECELTNKKKNNGSCFCKCHKGQGPIGVLGMGDDAFGPLWKEDY